MKERPILFNGEMVLALLDDRKGQTRRPVKGVDGHNWVKLPDGTGNHVVDERTWQFCPYGAKGDQVIPAMTIPSLGRNYAADVYGDIWSRAKGEWKRLKGSPTSKGYLSVTPAKDGKYVTRTIHRLVCETYYPELHPGTQVRHLDGEQLNNAPENLSWGTQEENWTDRIWHGKGIGEGHHNSKINMVTAAEIRRSDAPQRYLAAQYGVKQSTIWAIQKEIIWKNPRRKPDAPFNERWASRITLEVTGVRVEQLQDISDGDVSQEGTTWNEPLQIGRDDENCKSPAQRAFKKRWDAIYKNWDTNPWVWVVSFKRLTS